MADLKMTPARLALLRAVAQGRVSATIGTIRGTWATADAWQFGEPGAQRVKVTGRVAQLEDAKLVERAPVGVRYHQPRDYSLTKAGAKVLADLDAHDTPTT